METLLIHVKFNTHIQAVISTHIQAVMTDYLSTHTHTHTHTQREHGMWLTHLNPCNEISNVTGSLFHLAERRREGKD